LIKNEISSQGFLESARKKAGDFTRKRNLPFWKLCLFLLGTVRESLSVAFRRFGEKIGDEISMTEQSLSDARNKIRWEAFAGLSEKVGRFAYEGDYERWNGYRVWAIDGTKIALPNYPSLSAIYGNEKGSPMGRASIIYDVLNYVVFDAQLEPLSTDERTLAKTNLNALVKRMGVDKDLIISDRGYPSEDMIDFYESNGLFYLMRVRGKFNLAVDRQQSKDGYVKIGKHTVRVINVTLDSGETETLLTNLTEPFEFKELYFKRWGVEKAYDVLKNTLEIENFSGRTETAIRQDFYIHIIASNLLAASFWEAQETVDAERHNDSHKKYEYKVNVAQASGAVRDYLVLAIFTDDQDKKSFYLDKMNSIIASSVVPVRLGRIVPRKPNNRKAKFHHNRKSNL